MNDDEIEKRLAKMQPASLPKGLMAQLIAARPQPGTPRSLLTGSSWLRAEFRIFAAVALMAAAGFSIYLSYQRRVALQASLSSTIPVPVVMQPARIFLPVDQRNILIRADDLGIVDADTSHPVRLVRTVWVDDATFRSTDDGSEARITQPRERIIPVSLAIY